LIYLKAFLLILREEGFLSMNKLVICSVGTSISNECPSHRLLFSNNRGWDAESGFLKKEIQDALMQKNFYSGSLETAAQASAELNSLYRLGIQSGDKIVLLSSDNLQGHVCAEMISVCLQERFSILQKDIEIKRIEGLQVHNETLLREFGLKNLVKTLLSYLANENYRYSYEIIINPTGGFKGIVPFLTIMGMLYGRKSVYIFEYSKQLITLPPLPFSFDLDIYNRVRDALHFLEEEIAVPEQQFFFRIKDYAPEEHDLFTAFIEPFDESGKVTISPLAYCLLQIDSPEQSCFVSDNVIDTLRGVDSTMREKLIRLIDNIACPIWRNSHLHRWEKNDLLIIKPGNTAERFAGFMKNSMFYVALAYPTHTEYEKELSKYSRDSFVNVHFKKWKLNVHVDNAEKKESSVQQLLDAEIERNHHLEQRVYELEKKLNSVQQV